MASITTRSFKIHFIWAMFLLITWVFPNKVYFSPTGDDSNPGDSPSRPKQNVQAYLDNVQPGNDIHLAPGDYPFLKIRKSGTEEQWIRITSTTTNLARLRGAGSKGFEILDGASYIIIDGLDLDGGASALTLEGAKADYENEYPSAPYDRNGIFVDNRKTKEKSHHIVIRNCVVRGF